MTGALVAVCGIDGSGKSTQIAVIADHLRARGRDVVLTRQPTDRYRSDAIVRSALDLELDLARIAPELALFSAFDRIRHVREVIEPALAAGSVVVSDRYVYSTYAYFLSRGVDDLAWLQAINRHAPTPDLTIAIDVPPALAAERIIARDGSSRKREELDLDRMRVVQEAFRSQPWGVDERYHLVDGTRSREALQHEILALVDEVVS